MLTWQTGQLKTLPAVGVGGGVWGLPLARAAAGSPDANARGASSSSSILGLLCVLPAELSSLSWLSALLQPLLHPALALVSVCSLRMWRCMFGIVVKPTLHTGHWKGRLPE